MIEIKQILGLTCGMAYFLMLTALSQELVTVGSKENVVLQSNIEIPAKLDTGASLSSLSAKNIHIISKNDGYWVAFTFNYANDKYNFLLPLVKYTHILKRNDENFAEGKKFSERPVVELTICLGHQKEKILVNLVDRSHFSYPMLIGLQSLKQFHLLMDVSKDFLTKPACSK